MRWRYLAGVAFGLSLIATSSFGQVLDSRSSGGPPLGFFDDNPMATFHLADGRLLIDRCRYRVGTKAQENDGCKEVVAVSAQRTNFGLQYSAENLSQSWAVKATSQSAIRISSRRTVNRIESATLIQTDEGDVTMTHQIGDLSTQYDGASLLHVYLAAPETL